MQTSFFDLQYSSIQVTSEFQVSVIQRSVNSALFIKNNQKLNIGKKEKIVKTEKQRSIQKNYIINGLCKYKRKGTDKKSGRPKVDVHISI